jgi:hypothetical protein
MDDLYPFFRVSTAVKAQTDAQRMLATTVMAESEAQRMLAAQIEAVRKADRMHLQFAPRSGPARHLPQGLGPSSPPHSRRGRGRPRGSYDPHTLALEAEFPTWHDEVRRMKGRGPTLAEAAEHWGINTKTVARTLKRHPRWTRQFPMYKKRPKRL